MGIRHISPLARAIGVMGVVASLVGVVTYANLTSNTVALTNNRLASATAKLRISSVTSCTSGDTGSIQGFNNVKLTPGVTSSPIHFCLDNVGDIPLTITMGLTNPTGGTLTANMVTLNVSCDGNTALSANLSYFHSHPTPFSPHTLANGTHWNCSATATLNASYTGSGGQSVTPFDIQFTGTQVT